MTFLRAQLTEIAFHFPVLRELPSVYFPKLYISILCCTHGMCCATYRIKAFLVLNQSISTPFLPLSATLQKLNAKYSEDLLYKQKL